MATVTFFNDVCEAKNWEWYHRDEYAGKFYMAYIGYGDPEGLPREEFTQCRLWMINNLDGEVLIVEEKYSLGRGIYFHFSCTEDMSRFKLSPWGKFIHDGNW